jgi:hypothetical protein
MSQEELGELVERPWPHPSVRIQEDEQVASGLVGAGIAVGGETASARGPQQPHLAVVCRHVLGGSVGRGVVDDDDLPSRVGWMGIDGRQTS